MENKVNPSAVSRGSSLERSADGLLTLAGGKLTDYRKMAEGAMKMIQTILAEEYQKEFTLIDSKTIQFQAGNEPCNGRRRIRSVGKTWRV